MVLDNGTLKVKYNMFRETVQLHIFITPLKKLISIPDGHNDCLNNGYGQFDVLGT